MVKLPILNNFNGFDPSVGDVVRRFIDKIFHVCILPLREIVMSVVPIDIQKRMEAVNYLEQALEGMETACSFLASSDVASQLHYTIYIELVRSASNSAQGIKICIDMIRSGANDIEPDADVSMV